jgi:hypothetical protein
MNHESFVNPVMSAKQWKPFRKWSAPSPTGVGFQWACGVCREATLVARIVCCA